MASLTAQLRKLHAEQRRQEKEALKQKRALEKRLKEKARVSAIEQARLEVEAFENEVDVLLSVHKEQSTPISWEKFASALPPHEPIKAGCGAFAVSLVQGVAELENAISHAPTAEKSSELDDQDHRVTWEAYECELAEWGRMRKLAEKILAGELDAYSEAISDLSSWEDIPHLGSSIQITLHTPKLIECTLTVNGQEAVPAEMKSLTAGGKLTVKSMSKFRFHEIYQDYVCGCVLRLAREVFALLPAEKVLITACVNGTDTRTGQIADLPVLSVAIPRPTMESLDFERLDPSNSMENFFHRGDVKASRKNGEFTPISPLAPTDLVSQKPEKMDFGKLLSNVQQLRRQIGEKLKPVVTNSQS